MDNSPGMIGNFRYRKPLLLLVLIAGFTYLSWLILTGANVQPSGGARLVPLDLEPEKCPLDIKEAHQSGDDSYSEPPVEKIVQLDTTNLDKDLAPIDASDEEMGEILEELPELVMNKQLNAKKPPVWNPMLKYQMPFPEMSTDTKSNSRSGRSSKKNSPEWNVDEYAIPDLPRYDDDEVDPPLPKPKRKFSISPTEVSDKTFSQPTYQEGLDFVKNMMKHAWSGYKKFAWGMDELCPISQKGKNTLSRESMGLTPVDALDTLFLMGLTEEFEEARNIVLNEVDFDGQTVKLSLFETNIRVLGGLLSAYALTKDEKFKEKALDLGERFLPSFKKRIVPRNEFTTTSVHKFNRTQLREAFKVPASSASYYPVVSLAQIGTFSLEFGYLSDISGDPVFREKAVAIIEEIAAMRSTIPGLYPTLVAIGEESQFFGKYSVGAEADSFYEYLLKYWLYTGKKDKLHYNMYKAASKAIVEHLVAKDEEGRSYLVIKEDDFQFMQMEHLACFAPGMLALGAVNMGDDEMLALAGNLTESCYRMYHEQTHGIGCEVVSVPSMRPPRRGDQYMLRPEVIESIFILWRTTKNPRYRRWALEIARSIEETCRVPAGGYSGLEQINMDPPEMNDVQESFFLAETLKYLYLIFTSDDVVPLDKWVFNTEAHPLPIQNK